MARDLQAFCEVLDTMVEWFDAGEVPIDNERETLAAVRIAVTLQTRSTVNRMADLCVAVSDVNATGARREFLCALVLVGRAVVALETEHKLNPADVSAGERVLLTHAANAGAALGVADAAKLARVALDRGRTEGRQTGRFPEPGFARQLALGCLVAQYRDLGRLKQPDLVKLANAKGIKLTKTQLARIEGGTAAKGAPIDALIVCLGHDPKEFRVRADRVHDLARDLTCRVSGSPSGERWFAEFVAVYGERGARAGVALAACAAARLSPDVLRR